MTGRDEIRLSVDVPDVVVEPYRIEVRCGKTKVDVYEYGSRGSGSWAVWTVGGHVIDDTDRAGHELQDALARATAHVQAEERGRLFHQHLREVLSGGGDES